MPEPKPMDPDDLADLRLEVMAGNVGEAVAELIDAHDFFRARALVTEADVRERGIRSSKAINLLRERGIDMPLGQWFGSQEKRVATICNTAPVPWDALELVAKECKQ